MRARRPLTFQVAIRIACQYRTSTSCAGREWSTRRRRYPLRPSGRTTPCVDEYRIRMSQGAGCGTGRCCVNQNWHRALPRVGSSPIDRERLWSTKLGHSIEPVARTHRFDSLRCASPTSKSIAENRLVPEERVLDAPAVTTWMAIFACGLRPRRRVRCARTLPRPGHLEQAKRKSQLEWHSLCWPN